MDKVKDILTLLFTGCDGCPDAFAPAHAVLPAGSLRNPSINHHRANLTFGPVIGRLYIRLGQESEVAVRRIAFEALGQLFGQWMIRRPSDLLQKRGFNPFHGTPPSMGGQIHPPMQGIKQFFEPVQQFDAPAGQRFGAVLGQKPNLANQMRHAVLHANIKQPGILAIRAPVVGTDNPGKRFSEDLFKNAAAPRGIDLKQTVAGRIKTPRPVQLAVIVMAGLINIDPRFLRQSVRQFIIRLAKSVRYLLSRLAQQAPRKVQLDHLFEKLLNRAVRHMAGAFQIRHKRGHIRSEQAAFTDTVRQRRNKNPARHRVSVLSGAMFDHFVHPVRQFNLLKHKPLIQRFKTVGVFVCQLIFKRLIHLFRLKGRTRKLFMPVLAASLAFLTSRLGGGLLGLDNIARRRLGRIMRIFLEPSHLVFQLRNAFEKRCNLLSQFSNNFIFFVHAPLYNTGRENAQVAYFNIFRFL